MSTLVIGFAVAAVLMIGEYLLCTKLKNPLWGGIIPMIILAGSIFAFASGKIPLTRNNLFPSVVVNTIFLLNWGTGRDKYKQIRHSEMDKMKAKDI